MAIDEQQRPTSGGISPGTIQGGGTGDEYNRQGGAGAAGFLTPAILFNITQTLKSSNQGRTAQISALEEQTKIQANIYSLLLDVFKRQKLAAIKAKDIADDSRARPQVEPKLTKSSGESTNSMLGLVGTGIAASLAGIAAALGGLSPDHVKNLLTTSRSSPGSPSIIKSIKDGFTSIGPKIEGWVENTKKGFSDIMKDVKAKLTIKLPEGFQPLGESITKNYERLKTSINSNFEKFSTGLTERLKPFGDMWESTKIKTATWGKELKDSLTTVKEWLKPNEGGMVSKLSKWGGAVLSKMGKLITPIAAVFSGWDGWLEAIDRETKAIQNNPNMSTLEKTIYRVEGFVSGFAGSFIGGFLDLVKNVTMWPIKKIMGDNIVGEDGKINPEAAKTWWSKKILEVTKGFDEFQFARSLTDGMNAVFDLVAYWDKSIADWIDEKISAAKRAFGLESKIGVAFDQESEMSHVRSLSNQPFTQKEMDAYKKLLELGLIQSDVSKMTDKQIKALAIQNNRGRMFGSTRSVDLSEQEMRLMLYRMREGMKGNISVTPATTSSEMINSQKENRLFTDAVNGASVNVAPIVTDNSKTSGDTNVTTKVINGTPAPAGLYNRYLDRAF